MAASITNEGQIDKQQMLSQVSLFAGLPEETIARLAALSRVTVFPEGDEILEEGHEIDAEYDGLYLLIGGSVEVRKGSTDGADGQLLATLHAGDFFGEMALLDNHPRSASVYATEECQCLVLNRWDFVNQLRANPDIALKMLSVLSERLRRTSADAV